MSAGMSAGMGAGMSAGMGAGMGTAGPVLVGVDVVEVERLAAALARRPALGRRLFSDAELADAGARPDRAASTSRLAARFAAKEAVMKALGVGIGSFGWHDVAVRRSTGGAPVLRLAGRAAELAAERSAGPMTVSLSHTAAYAVAVVAAPGVSA